MTVTLDPRGIADYPADFWLGVARGDFQGISGGQKFGANSDVDTGTEDVVSQGGTVNILGAGAQLALKSASANDDVGGTGATEVTLYYLDDSYVEQTEAIAMDGTNLVNTTATDILRPYRAIVTAAGSGDINAGNIVINNTGDTTTYLQIDASAGQTLSAFMTVPANKEMYVYRTNYHTGETSKEATFEFVATADNDGTNIAPIFVVKDQSLLIEAADTHDFMSPLRFNAQVDMKIRCTAAANNTPVSASFDFILVDA